VDVYLEVGSKKTFAGAVEWAGWCRSGRDAAAALQALLLYAGRYQDVLQGTGLVIAAPADVESLTIVQRLAGNSTTDFGAPAVALPGDTEPMDEAALKRALTILEACWRALDSAAELARGRELRKGPRGGGRELDGILRHVLGGDAGYLTSLGWKFKEAAGEDLQRELQRTRQAIRQGLAAAVRGELAERGPRGGIRWPARYYVRRAAWHVLDHAWEIEDRL
jgi:hypothetical protein